MESASMVEPNEDVSESPPSSESSTEQFTVGLFDTGDEGAAFRLKNGAGEIQRPYILDKGSSYISLQGDLLSVIHGTLTPSGPLASLIVAEFRFLSAVRSRQFRNAMVQFIFSQTGSANTGCPKVVAIAPEGRFEMNPTKVVEERKARVGVGINVTAPVGVPGNFQGGWEWQSNKAQERVDCTSLVGVKRVEGSFRGSRAVRNSARWTLTENETLHSGIPTLLRIAILLELSNTQLFQASIKVSTKVDIAYTITNSVIGRVFKGEKVDPVLFDPTSPRHGDLLPGVDPDNLAATDFRGLWKVEMTTKKVPKANNGPINVF